MFDYSIVIYLLIDRGYPSKIVCVRGVAARFNNAIARAFPHRILAELVSSCYRFTPWYVGAAWADLTRGARQGVGGWRQGPPFGRTYDHLRVPTLTLTLTLTFTLSLTLTTTSDALMGHGHLRCYIYRYTHTSIYSLRCPDWTWPSPHRSTDGRRGCLPAPCLTLPRTLRWPGLDEGRSTQRIFPRRC